MNASLVSHLDEITSPLSADASPSRPGVAFDSGKRVGADTVQATAKQWLPGQMVGNRYRIGRVLEVGGMATVYEAMQLDLGRRVAIKVPTAACAVDPDCARRFAREARTLAGLQHPHIVSVFELGRSELGVDFMAMELVEGLTLRAHLLAERSLAWNVATAFAAQLADALEAAHAAGVVHGDVSAANVLLKRRGNILVCKLIDFGAARRIDDGDMPHRTFGTRRYVAPELLGGHAPQIRSDLFALGALLKEMLGEAALAESPEALQQLVRSMLNADPHLRPESAAEVSLRLRDVLDPPEAVAQHDDGPICADPQDAPRRLRQAAPRAPRSRRGWIAAGGVVGGAVVCALVAYARYRAPAAALPVTSVAVAQVARVDRQSAAPVKAPRIVAAPPSAPAKIGARPASAPAITVPGRAEKPKAVPAPVRDTDERPGDVSTEREQIVALLDSWFDARNRDATVGQIETVARVGEPRIAFDPSGTSASVTYRKRVVYSGSGRTEQSIEEQVFFAKPGDAWQLVDPDGR